MSVGKRTRSNGRKSILCLSHSLGLSCENQRILLINALFTTCSVWSGLEIRYVYYLTLHTSIAQPPAEHHADFLPTSHFLMPSSLALTPGLGSFLKCLKTNPIDTSIETLISYVSQNFQS